MVGEDTPQIDVDRRRAHTSRPGQALRKGRKVRSKDETGGDLWAGRGANLSGKANELAKDKITTADTASLSDPPVLAAPLRGLDYGHVRPRLRRGLHGSHFGCR